MMDFFKGFVSLVQRPGQAWGFEERRALVRLRCKYKAMVEYAGERRPGLVTDIGEGGLGLRTDHKLAKGHKVVIFCPFIDLDGCTDPVEGEVCWAHSSGSVHYSGMRYARAGGQDSWVNALLHLLGFPAGSISSKRRWARADCVLPGRLGERPVEVHNLGVGGALLGSPAELPQGPQTLEVGPHAGLPILTVSGHLVSERGAEELHFSGMEFDALSPEQLSLLGQYLKKLLGRTLRPVD